jgi:hypothetical protein
MPPAATFTTHQKFADLQAEQTCLLPATVASGAKRTVSSCVRFIGEEDVAVACQNRFALKIHSFPQNSRIVSISLSER